LEDQCGVFDRDTACLLRLKGDLMLFIREDGASIFRVVTGVVAAEVIVKRDFFMVEVGVSGSPLTRFENMIGLTFSVSSSKVVADRFPGVTRADTAVPG
jgi:hypothetical protein